jgi:hypothetical protein
MVKAKSYTVNITVRADYNRTVILQVHVSASVLKKKELVLF